MVSEVGTKYLVRPTFANKKNGLLPHKGAWISFIDSSAITLYFEQFDAPSLKIPLPYFGVNFELDQMAPVNSSYAADKHAERTFEV